MSMRQFDLFAGARSKVHVPQLPDTEAIRLRLIEVLEQLRAAQQMPWEPSQLRSWTHVFHNMANWLPQDERDSLRREFSREIERLRQASTVAAP
jgi:hypothetical protein